MQTKNWKVKTKMRKFQIIDHHINVRINFKPFFNFKIIFAMEY